jgi:hypothetical protein
VTSKDVLRTGRRETIRQSAYRLADSGSYSDWQSFESFLCARYGLLETRRLLADLSLRSELNRRCAAARKKRNTRGDAGDEGGRDPFFRMD